MSDITQKIQAAKQSIAEIKAKAAGTYCSQEEYSKIAYYYELIMHYQRYAESESYFEKAKERLLDWRFTLNSPHAMIEEVHKHNALGDFVRDIRLFNALNQ